MKRVPLAVLALALASASHAAPAAAQTTRPWLEWRTLRTEHFDVHYPAELEAWTHDVASRLEGIHAAVAGFVGSAPEGRVTVVVDDPAGEVNGLAFSLIGAPYIQFYPTPPDPRSVLGNTRGPAELLAVHEFAHVAHLTRPSRNPLTRFLDALLPGGAGPVADNTPRWVREGYATYVEGRLTGSGRPHSAIRAAILRQWALEGRLPPYERLDALAGDYHAGSMAYLAGSAFLEWLAARRGEESLVHLWRRLSARTGRGFDEAFAGVYGGSPREMYGLFVVELTARALEARRVLAQFGLVAGDTIQRLSRGTGDPAVSADGQHLAIALGGATATAGRIVVWRTQEEPEDSAAAAARAQALARDPEDVPAIQPYPRPKRVLATLRPAAGDQPYAEPRFLPGGDELLVVRGAEVGGGTTRSDLFVWNWKRNTIRRVTRGASIRAADPTPDGRRAAAVQCLNGFCGLVMVDLGSGEIVPLASGGPDRVFDRPRVSPDGSTVAAAMQEGGRWKLVAVNAGGGALRVLYEDPAASVYDPAFTADGEHLLAVSEAGGVPHVVRIPLSTGVAEPLTRVTGATLGPEPDPRTGEIYFLSLHAGGMDLQRLPADAPALDGVVALPAALAPAAPPVARAPADTLPRAPLPAPRPYGIGPRATLVLPFGAANVDGGTGGVFVHNADPVGRLSLGAAAAYGSRGTERGASATASWRGWRPALEGTAFFVSHAPSRLGAGVDAGLDAAYGGVALSLTNAWTGGRLGQGWRLGASAGWLDGEEWSGERLFGFARYVAASSRQVGRGSASTTLDLSAAAGRTAGEGWTRALLDVGFGAGIGGLSVRVEGTLGRTTSTAPEWERFTVGGSAPLLVTGSVLSQRVPLPAIRWGTLRGDRLAAYRITLPMGGVTPYFWGGSTDPRWNEWVRVTGIESSFAVPAFRAAGTPAVRVLAGVAYTLDGPDEHHVTGYLGAGYTP